MRLLFKILQLSFLLLLAESAGSPGLAAETPKTAELVMFIAYADVPPYYLNTAQARGNGILMDVLRAVAEPLGYTVTPRQLPDRRGWRMLEHGGVDVYATAREWVAEPERFLWTDAFMPNEDVLLCLATSTLRYAGPESLYGKTVAGIRGFLYPALEGHFGPGGIIRLDTTSPQALLELLRRGRADAVLVNRTEILWMFRNLPNLQPTLFRIDETPVGTAEFRFLFPRGRGWEPVIDQFNGRLREMKRDGSLKAILDLYR